MEVYLETCKVVRHVCGQLAQLLPAIAQVADHVCLFLGHTHFIPHEQGVHVLNGVDQVVNVGLLLTDLQSNS